MSPASRYNLICRLARGGMADVFIAQAVGAAGVEKYAVVKRMLPALAADPEHAKAFLDEARLSASLSHHNIAQVYEVIDDGDSYLIAMEYLHGFDLDLVLSRLRARECAMPLAHSLTIVAGAAAGLHYAHDRLGPDGRPLDVVHRDVSPSNVMITFDGGVKLIDFGIAKDQLNRHLTLPGVVKGTVGYMSPEQCLGWPLDRRSDIFGLGILLYELTTMCLPYRSDDEHDLMTEVVSSTPRPPSSRIAGYPPDLERIVMRALSPEREGRYQTARQLLFDLERLAASLALPLSASALGDFMKGIFGSIPEPWLVAQPFGAEIGDDEPTEVSFAVSELIAAMG
jgi:eukaryotic-like serine/threonine-protein kinase